MSALGRLQFPERFFYVRQSQKLLMKRFLGERDVNTLLICVLPKLGLSCH